MTPEDIHRMAREAGYPYLLHWNKLEREFLERFAALVAEREREECAKVCIDTGAQAGVNDFHFEMADLCAEVIKARGKQ